jgi:hypothetical protein
MKRLSVLGLGVPGRGAAPRHLPGAARGQSADAEPDGAMLQPIRLPSGGSGAGWPPLGLPERAIYLLGPAAPESPSSRLVPDDPSCRSTPPPRECALAHHCRGRRYARAAALRIGDLLSARPTVPIPWPPPSAGIRWVTAVKFEFSNTPLLTSAQTAHSIRNVIPWAVQRFLPLGVVGLRR